MTVMRSLIMMILVLIAERSATTPTDQRPHTNATFAAEIVSPTSVSTATSDAATVEQTGQPGCTPMVKLDRRRP